MISYLNANCFSWYGCWDMGADTRLGVVKVERICTFHIWAHGGWQKSTSICATYKLWKCQWDEAIPKISVMDNFSGYTRWTVPRSFWWSVCCAVCCFACWFISWSVIGSVCCSVCMFIWVHLLVVMVVVTMSNGKYWPRAQSEVLVLIDLFSTMPTPEQIINWQWLLVN